MLPHQSPTRSARRCSVISAAIESLEFRRLFSTVTVTSVADTIAVDGVVTLREAITSANNNANVNADVVGVGAYGSDTINFNIPGAGLHTIAPATLLPVITDAVKIDGYSQPGSSVNTLATGSNAILNIEIRGSNAALPLYAYGLKITADNSTVRGLIMNEFEGTNLNPFLSSGTAILIEAKGALIEGNFLGFRQDGNASGVSFLAGLTEVGVLVSGPNSGTATIGGTTLAARNLIYAKTAVKLLNSSNNSVIGNHLGVDAAGNKVTQFTFSAFSHVAIYSGNNNTVGGTTAAEANLTAGNVLVGLDYVTNVPTLPNSNNNRILGNSYINDGDYAINLFRRTDPRTDIFGRNIVQDPLDVDTGPNGVQNPPTIVSAITNGATTTVKVRLTTKANQTYRIELYSDHGRNLLTTLNLTTDGSGVAESTFAIAAIAVGSALNATATGTEGTSEFSLAQTVQDVAASAASLVVTNTNDSGAGSLRQAMLNANKRINGATPDVITFNIAGTGVKTIAPLTALPIILDPVVIDGYSQPTSSLNTLAVGSNAILRIEVSGANIGDNSNPYHATVFNVQASNTTLRGLVVNGSAGSGIDTGGVEINVFGVANFKLEGSFVGTNAAGTAAAAKPYTGVFLEQVFDSTIGGSAAGARNVISGNFTGLILRGTGTYGNTISNNYIGTNAAGTGAIANLIDGITISSFAYNNTIGGTTAAERNVISGNSGNGIANDPDGLQASQSIGAGNKIQGNYIGTNAGGIAALGNGASGIDISDASLVATENFLIGGTAPGAGNLISGNAVGVSDASGFGLSALGTPATVVIQGNRIGTSAAGTASLANGIGILSTNSGTKFFVGGTTAAARNIISGNTGNGIQDDALSSGVNVQGNYIGTDITGSLPLANGGHGILLKWFAARIGDAATAGSGNLIAFNTKDGIAVTGFEGNRIARNSIHSNGGLGIDLSDDGVTSTQDDLDADSGPNGLQNIPTIFTAILNNAGTTSVDVRLKNKASKTYRVEFFANDAQDASGFGEGKNYIGAADITTDASGLAQQTVTFTGLTAGQYITATATNADGTSEFSGAATITRAAATTLTINDLNINEGDTGTTAFGFTVTRAGDLSATTTVNYAAANNTATLADADFAALVPGTLTFLTNETVKTITINVNGDSKVETDETFFINLTSPTGAAIADNQGLGTIVNDDAVVLVPTFSINDVSASEGDTGTTAFEFTVTRTGDTTGTNTIAYATADGTALVTDNDYAAQSATLTFNPGDTSKKITVLVNGDAAIEGNETFFVNLSNPTAGQFSALAVAGPVFNDSQGQGTITNDDAAPVPTTFSIGDVRKSEGNSGTSVFSFSVTRAGNTTGSDTIAFATSDGSGTTADADYIAQSGQITFAPGETSKSIDVIVNGDTKVEGSETFTVTLSNPVAPTLTSVAIAAALPTFTDAQGLGTIVNDDAVVVPPSPGKVSIVQDPCEPDDTAVKIEGTSGADVIVITRSGLAQGLVKVTINGTTKGTFRFTGSILVYGLSGSDTISIDSNITRHTMIFAGAGNDTVTGGSGDDVILGSEGYDQIFGGAGRDILIGGNQSDKIDGQAGEDVLVAGGTKYENNLVALCRLSDEWSRTNLGYSSRVSNLRLGKGLTGGYKLDRTTANSSGYYVDTLKGGSGTDLFYARLIKPTDIFIDRTRSETAVDVSI